jgi:hypothetical protein
MTEPSLFKCERVERVSGWVSVKVERVKIRLRRVKEQLARFFVERRDEA